MRPCRSLSAVLGALALLVLAPTAQGNLLGRNVRIDSSYAGSTVVSATVLAADPTVEVSCATPSSSGPFCGININGGGYSIDLRDSDIVFQTNSSFGSQYGSDRNYLRFSVADSSGVITSASLVSSNIPGLTSSRVTLSSGVITMDVSGLPAPAVESTVIAVQVSPLVAPTVRVINGSPLKVNVGSDMSFQIFNSAVPGSGQFYPDSCTSTGDSGVFVRQGTTLYAPNFAQHPCGSATSSIGAYSAWVPVSIGAVTGTGTSTDPFSVVVVADAGLSGIRLTMTVTYVNGENFARKTLAFTPFSLSGRPEQPEAASTFDAFLGADLYLAASDDGVPYREPTSGAVGGQTCVGTGPTYTILMIPLTPASRYAAAGYSTIWSQIGTGTLGNTVTTGCQDNGSALQWSSLTLPATIQTATSFGDIPAITQFNVTSVTPTQGAAGTSVPVTVAGIGFQAGTTFSFGAGITVQGLEIISSGSASMTLVIDPAAASGARSLVGTQSPGGLTSTLPNAFTVTGGGGGPTPPDLSISKTHSGSFAAGATGTYQLTVTNGSSAGATTGAITVTDSLPTALTFLSGGGNGFSCTADGSLVACTSPGPLAPGASVSFSISVRVATTAPSSVTNVATVSTTGDVNPANNTAADPTTITGSGGPSPSFGLILNPRDLSAPAGSTRTMTVSVLGLNGFAGAVSVTSPSVPGVTFDPASFSLATGATQTVTLTIAAGAPTGTQTATFRGTASIGTRTSNLNLTITAASSPDFSLGASPGALTVQAGGTGTTSVTAQGLNGFTGAVAVSAQAPSGLAVSPGTFSLATSPAGSQTATIAVDAATAAGTYTVTFTGTASGLASPRTTTVAVTVVPAPDFTLAATPTTLTVQAGRSGTASVAAQGVNGFTGSVSVAASAPTGLSASPASFALATSPAGSQAVTIAVDAATAAGTYTVTFTGTASGVAAPRTASVAVTVVPAPDFSLAVVPSSVSFFSRGRTSVSVSVTARNGFTGDVAVTAPTIQDITFTPASFTIAAGTTQVVTVETATATPLGTRTGAFSGTASGVTGARTATFTVNFVPPPPTIESFVAAPASVNAGSSSTLTWVSRDGSSAELDNGVGSVPVSGSVVVTPSATTTYKLTVTGFGGVTVTADVTVTVVPCVAPNAPESPRIAPAGNPNGPVTATDVLALSWAPPATGPTPTRYEYRINGSAYTSTTATSATAAPRGNATPIQLFVRAFSCSPEQGPGPEASSPVYALAPPVADFAAPATAVLGRPVTLTDSSSPQATSWIWIYDDTAVAGTTQSQTHTFTTVGTHVVVLVAINGSGSSSKTRTINVTASLPPPSDLTVRALDGEDPTRQALDRVSLTAGRRSLLRILPGGDGQDLTIFLRLVDRDGTVREERRLVVPTGAEAAYDLAAYGPRGELRLELVAGQPFRATLEEGPAE